MLSPTFIVPQITRLQLPCPLEIRSPVLSNRPRNCRRTVTKKCHSDYPSSFPSSPKNPSSLGIETPTISSSQEDPVTSIQSVNHWVDSDLLASQLQSCYTIKEVRALHGMCIKCLKLPVTFLDNNLISSYGRFGELVDARKVFDKMPERNVVSWSAMLNGYLSFGIDVEALKILREFIASGVQPNYKTFVCILNLCTRRLDFELGEQVHACIIKGNWSNLVVDSAVLYLYAQCGDLVGAFRAFDRMRDHDVVSWTTMVTACSQHGWAEEAIWIYSKMLSEGFSPNEFTVCSVLKACGEEMALKLGRQLHGAVVKKIYKNDIFIGTAFVDMYAKCKEISDAKKVFDGMRKRNTATWTSIIAGYARNGLGEEAMSLFRLMRQRRIFANNLTMVSLLKACGSVKSLLLGKEVHAQLVKNSSLRNAYIGSTLVWLYCKCDEYSIASKVLQRMPLKDVIPWTAMISGCAGLGHESEALGFLKEMLGEGVEPNPYTYASALKACAKLKNIQQGRLIHSSVQKTTAISDVYVGSSLIFMYGKCGQIQDAVQVFESMPERNLVSWKTMIVGYAKNGLRREAFELIYRMLAKGTEVDDYIRETVLTASGDTDGNLETT